MIRIAVVGLGKMGLSHLAIVNAHPDVELAAVCDSSGYVLGVLRKYTGVTTYSDYDTMLRDCELDAVLIATPSRTHAQHGPGRARAGPARVLREAVHAVGSRDAERADRAGPRAGPGHPGRLPQPVRRRLRRGQAHCSTWRRSATVTHVLGEAYGPVVLKPKGGTWRSRKEEGGGALYDYAAHPLNLLNWYLGEPAGVGGTVLNSIFSREIDDEVHSTLYFDGGRSARISVNWSDESYRKMTTRITIWGTTGRIFADRQEVQVYLRDTATVPDGYQHGLERPLHDRADRAGRLLPARRGVQRADRPLRRARSRRVASTASTRSTRAAETDRVIAMMIARRPARRLDRRQRRRRARAAPAHARRRRRLRLPRLVAQPAGQSVGHARNTKGILMDRLLFGDNQFFGVNHMSEEKARAQAMRFQALDAIIDVLDAAYDAGVRTFMCTTHERVAADLRSRARPSGALRGLRRSTRACRTPTSTPTP